MTKIEDTSDRLEVSSDHLKTQSGEKEPISQNTPQEHCEKKSELSKWRKIFIIIALTYANFWTAACVSLQAPFFPQEAELKGATPTQYGLVFGIFELVIIFMSPVYGKLIPKVTPKFLITAGVFIEGAACILFGVLDKIPPGTTYIGMAFAVRIVEGFGAAAVMTASFTITASEFTSSVATTFSLLETAFGFGLMIGPTIGGALYQIGDFLLPFFVCGVFLLVGSLLNGFLLPSSEEVKVHQSRNLKAFLLDGGIIMNTLAIVTSLLFIGFNAATLEPHLRNFDLSPVILGTIFVITGGIYAITTPIWGRICDKGADPYIITFVGYCLTCTGILLIGPVPFIPFTATLWTVIVSLLIIGLGLAAKLVASFVGALKDTINRGFPDDLGTYGMVSALFSTACSTGAFIGPSLGGFLLDATGYETGTIVIFAQELFFLVALVVFIVMRRRSNSKVSERTPLLKQGSQESKVGNDNV